MSHPILTGPSSISTLLTTVGLTLSGIQAGLALSYPIITNAHYALKHQGDHVDPPAPTHSASLTLNQRLTIWERSYKAGLAIPSIGLTCSTIWATIYFKEKGKLQVLTPNWGWLAIGAVAQASILPFTVSSGWRPPSALAHSVSSDLFPSPSRGRPVKVLIIAPLNNKLFALRKRANKEGDAAVNEQEVEKLFQQWQSLHLVRCGALVTGLVATIGAFIW